MTELAFAAPAEVGLCPDRLQRLLAVLQADIDRGRLPGAVALVARRGKIALFESLGRQDPAAGSAMARDSIFRIYSMTKPVVSVAVMMLVEQGRLLLSDPVARHLPEFANQKVAVEREGRVELEDLHRPATVQDLLRHTAGLTYEFLGNAEVQRQYARLQMGSRERSNAEFSGVLAGLPLMYQPGSVWEYSRATDVLGRLVEVLSGQTLGEYLRRNIFIPLGMHDTGFSVEPADRPRIAEPFAHDPDGGVPMRVLEPRRAAAMESGGGGLLSTAMAYARFLQFMRNRGELDGVRLLGSRTVDFMTADHLGAIPVTGDVLPPGYGFGLGFAVRTATGIASVPGSKGLYYWGGIAGTTFFVDPAEDLYAVLMIQAPNQRDHYRPLFRSLVYAALLD
ncbi:MAG: serine hydrolase domain-containing protein [Polaromonas sp.]|uniref:serine hydrolase domain-containing protein n=1 Tax=Polaromonas sp. TaxID=1869339 RepID=UPI0027225E18|nr:serine hydrolase domain-containing protein [Polaromonas sp.]MDO9115215.1 serine hydrolase domain-containing protein [Polaromonas sp.]MDP1889055.1 serine hydrolase domain-containing protein [Polaromonas sp.]